MKTEKEILTRLQKEWDIIQNNPSNTNIEIFLGIKKIAEFILGKIIDVKENKIYIIKDFGFPHKDKTEIFNHLQKEYDFAKKYPSDSRNNVLDGMHIMANFVLDKTIAYKNDKITIF